MTETARLYVDMGNGMTGPFTIDQVQHLIRNGMVNEKTQVRWDPNEPSLPARMFAELSPLLPTTHLTTDTPQIARSLSALPAPHTPGTSPKPTNKWPKIIGAIAVLATVAVGIKIASTTSKKSPASGLSNPTEVGLSRPDPAQLARQEAAVAEKRRLEEQINTMSLELKKAGPAVRLREAKAFASRTIATREFSHPDGTALLRSVASEGDAPLIKSIIGATMAAHAVREARDGASLDLPAIRTAADALLANGKSGLMHLPTTTRGAAMKDPASNRGKVIATSGEVLQIHRDGNVFVGTFMSESIKIVYFITPFPTDNIEEGTSANFRGVFVQEYDFPNVSGGQTQSVALVGAFN